MMTEIDVRCAKDKNTCPVVNLEPWTQEMISQQAHIYERLMQICIDASNCKSWTTWGYTDYLYFLQNDPEQKAMLWDVDFNPKMAKTSVANVLLAADRAQVIVSFIL